MKLKEWLHKKYGWFEHDQVVLGIIKIGRDGWYGYTSRCVICGKVLEHSPASFCSHCFHYPGQALIIGRCYVNEKPDVAIENIIAKCPELKDKVVESYCGGGN